jgi:hypothetical protein
MEVCGGTAHTAPHILNPGTTKRQVLCFLAQPLYPEHGLNRRIGWPQRLSGCFEEERKIFPCLKLMDDTLVIQPTAHLLVKQTLAQQVQTLTTLHTAWTFILGLQAPWARTIPSETSHLM